jgi:hypothetical protein
MSAGLPGFVDFGSLVSLPPPFIGKGGELLALVLDGDMKKIEDFCEEVLNGPANGAVRYTPIASQVLLMAGSFAEITSGAQKFISSGSVAETQLALFIPLTAEKKEGGGFVDNGFCVAVPYIFVDNPMSFASGREDFGYPKAMGVFSPANGLGSPMTMQAFGGNLGANSKAGWTTLLTLERTGTTTSAEAASGPSTKQTLAAEAEARWRPPSEIVPYFLAASGANADALGILKLLETITDLIKALLDKSARQSFLKEFRDAQVSTAACYQAIVEAPFQVVDFTWRPSSQWRVNIESLTSHPITDELGVATQSTWKALELRMGLRIAQGQVVAP